MGELLRRFALAWILNAITIAVLLVPGAAQADEVKAPVRVGGVAEVTREWLATMQKHQSDFYGTLAFDMGIDWHDDIPFDRLKEMYGANLLDCIVTNVIYLETGMVHSTHKARFELVLFGRADDSLVGKRVVTVGLLATVPYVDLPLTQEIQWYGLRSFDQGAELVKAGRIDLFIAHAGLYDRDPMIEEVMALPSIRLLELAVQCHDTPSNRAFLKSFDASLSRIEHEAPPSLPN